MLWLIFWLLYVPRLIPESFICFILNPPIFLKIIRQLYLSDLFIKNHKISTKYLPKRQSVVTANWVFYSSFTVDIFMFPSEISNDWIRTVDFWRTKRSPCRLPSPRATLLSADQFYIIRLTNKLSMWFHGKEMNRKIFVVNCNPRKPKINLWSPIQEF